MKPSKFWSAPSGSAFRRAPGRGSESSAFGPQGADPTGNRTRATGSHLQLGRKQNERGHRITEDRKSAQRELGSESAAGIVRICCNRRGFLGRRSPSHLTEQNPLSLCTRLVLTLVAWSAVERSWSGALPKLAKDNIPGNYFRDCHGTV